MGHHAAQLGPAVVEMAADLNDGHHGSVAELG
jgi:hypothetical protein